MKVLRVCLAICLAIGFSLSAQSASAQPVRHVLHERIQAPLGHAEMVRRARAGITDIVGAYVDAPDAPGFRLVEKGCTTHLLEEKVLDDGSTERVYESLGFADYQVTGLTYYMTAGPFDDPIYILSTTLRVKLYQYNDAVGQTWYRYLQAGVKWTQLDNFHLKTGDYLKTEQNSWVHSYGPTTVGGPWSYPSFEKWYTGSPGYPDAYLDEDPIFTVRAKATMYRYPSQTANTPEVAFGFRP